MALLYKYQKEDKLNGNKLTGNATEDLLKTKPSEVKPSMLARSTVDIWKYMPEYKPEPLSTYNFENKSSDGSTVKGAGLNIDLPEGFNNGLFALNVNNPTVPGIPDFNLVEGRIGKDLPYNLGNLSVSKGVHTYGVDPENLSYNKFLYKKLGNNADISGNISVSKNLDSKEINKNLFGNLGLNFLNNKFRAEIGGSTNLKDNNNLNAKITYKF
jgi:hypothetical protein